MWSDAATLLFRELCGSKLLVGIVDEYVNGVLHLFLCDTSTEADVYLHHVLSDGGHADICEETVPAQVRREASAAGRAGEGWVGLLEWERSSPWREEPARCSLLSWPGRAVAVAVTGRGGSCFRRRWSRLTQQRCSG